MKIIHQNGYTVDELGMYRLTIYKNIVDCAKSLIGAMRQLEIEPELDVNHTFCDYLMEYSVDPDPEKPLELKVGQAVSSIWHDPCVPKVLEHQTSFYIMDSAPYDGESGAVRLCGEFQVVHEDQYNIVSKQGRPFQAETGPLSAQQLLSRLLWR